LHTTDGKFYLFLKQVHCLKITLRFEDATETCLNVCSRDDTALAGAHRRDTDLIDFSGTSRKNTDLIDLSGSSRKNTDLIDFSEPSRKSSDLIDFGNLHIGDINETKYHAELEDTSLAPRSSSPEQFDSDSPNVISIAKEKGGSFELERRNRQLH
jgi:hypothetical protein